MTEPPETQAVRPPSLNDAIVPWVTLGLCCAVAAPIALRFNILLAAQKIGDDA